MKRRSQASLEMMMAAGIVLLMFIFMLTVAYHINKQENFYDNTAELEKECLKLSARISQTYLIGHGAESELFVYNNITVESGDYITIISEESEASCRTIAGFTNSTENDFRLHWGNLSIRNVQGDIMVKNI